MFPEISDYLKSTLGNNISNLVQPDKLAAAAIFLLLNLGNIILNTGSFSTPDNPLHPLFDTFFKMDPILQGSADIVIIIVLAYLLLSFNTAIMKAFTGEAWTETWPAGFFKNLQMRKRDRLMRESSQGETLSNNLAHQQLITGFAPDQTDARPTAIDIYPTALGNVQGATVSYIYNHYGIEMAALWPHMESVVEAADSALSKRIDNEKAALDFLVNMSFLSIVFAIELLVQFFILFSRTSLPWILLPIALAVITYQGAVLKARTWGDVVQVAFDMHRDDLRQKLGIRPFTSQEDERTVWKKVSNLLLWGEPAGDIFISGDAAKPAVAPGATKPAVADEKVTVRPLADIKADIQSIVVSLDTPSGAQDLNIAADNNLVVVSQYIDYFLVVHNTTHQEIRNALLYVTDSRIPIIYTKPIAQTIERRMLPGVHATIIPQNDDERSAGKQLIWSIDHIEAGKSLLICYRLSSQMFAAIASAGDLTIDGVASTETLCSDTGAIDYTIAITAASPGQINGAIEVFDSRKALPDEEKYGCLWYDESTDPHIIAAQKLTAPERYRWNLSLADSGDMDGQIQLTYTL
jgi:hypothetical protein